MSIGTPKCMRNASVTARIIIVCFVLCWLPYVGRYVAFGFKSALGAHKLTILEPEILGNRNINFN